MDNWKELEKCIYYNEEKDSFIGTDNPNPTEEYLNNLLEAKIKERYGNI